MPFSHKCRIYTGGKCLQEGCKQRLESSAQEGIKEFVCYVMQLLNRSLVAQVKGIPFLAFDAGGVLEMFDGKLHKDNVVLDPTLAALSEKLNEVKKVNVCMGDR